MSDFSTLVLLVLVPLLPLVGAALNALLSRTDLEAVKVTVGNVAAAGSFLCALSLFFMVLTGSIREGWRSELWNWVLIGNFQVDFAFYLDTLSAIMILIVTGVGFLIHLYSVGYMKGDESSGRYFALLNLFLFFMTWLVLADNLVMMFLGWEGVAFCSWALIGFWFSEEQNVAAGNKAFLVNRVGDVAFLIGIFLLFWTQVRTGAGEGAGLQFALLNDPSFVNDYLAGTGTLWAMSVPVIAGFCLLLGATGKSAQIPLYVWLPDAMAGPTPVSALIHAATMVTAGVYLMCRLHLLFALSPILMIVVAFVGAVTLLMAALFACFETDFKKILAYSTISQIGYMFLAVGAGAYAAGMFHLVTHAFFKALLFLCSGAVLHALGGIGDIREMGGLRKKMPVTFWTFLIAALALVGIPPFAGFWSKDEILWFALAGKNGSFVLWLFGVTGVFFTALYTFRLFFVSFTGEPRMEDPDSVHPPGWFMKIPMLVLAVFSILAGFAGVPEHIGHALGIGNWIESFLHYSGLHTPVIAEAFHGQEFLFMGISIVIGLLGIVIAWGKYGIKETVPGSDEELTEDPMRRVFQNKWYVDEAGYLGIVRPVKRFAGAVSDGFETVFVDTLLVNGSALVVRALAWVYSLVQNGRVGRYIFWIWIGIAMVLLMMLS